ncbi:MAG: hypothetical protein Q4C87_02515 [Actinomycetaceae bacterium]|nr:hypothetical protein [Actinomycetaceae bacterium]
MSETPGIIEVIKETRSLEEFLDYLNTLPDKQRAWWRKEFIASQKEWLMLCESSNWIHFRRTFFEDKKELHSSLMYAQQSKFARYLMAMGIVFDLPPAHVARMWNVGNLWRVEGKGQISLFVDLIAQRGNEWVEKFIPALIKVRGIADLAHLLTVPLIEATHAPMPVHDRYLRAWMTRADNIPRPGQRWEEHFLAVCRTSRGFNQPIYLRDERQGKIAQALAEMRKIEPLNDAALFDGLLSVIDRGEVLSAQKHALWWMDVLQITSLIHSNRDRVLAALFQAERPIVKTLITQLLAEKTSDAELERIAEVVLAGKDKGLKRDILRQLKQRPKLSVTVTSLVQDIAAGSDIASGKLATQLLSQWGENATIESAVNGLWQEPQMPEAEPFAAEHLLDDVTFETLIADLYNQPLTADMVERTLMHCVAIAHHRGVDDLINRLSGFHEKYTPSQRWHLPGKHLHGKWHHFLGPLIEGLATGDIRPGERPEQTIIGQGPLQLLAALRCQDIICRLGEIPCLLSTPSNTRYAITWDDFCARLALYAQENVPVEPTDLAIALSRIAADQIGDLTISNVTIRDCDIAIHDVITARAANTIPPAHLGFNRVVLQHWSPHRFIVSGDEPTWHSMLGVESPWTHPYSISQSVWKRHDVEFLPSIWDQTGKGVLVDDNNSATLKLLPGYSARPALVCLHDFVFSTDSEGVDALISHLDTMQRCLPITAFAVVAAVGKCRPVDNEKIAAALFDAWNYGTIDPKDFAQGWATSYWDDNDAQSQPPFERKPLKLVPFLSLIAEGGGLALAWPFLVTMAEDLAGQDKPPATTGAVLELVLQYLPEVRAAGFAVDLPATCALANRKGKTKAITVAQRIVEAM